MYDNLIQTQHCFLFYFCTDIVILKLVNYLMGKFKQYYNAKKHQLV